jgi:O-antigen ligase
VRRVRTVDQRGAERGGPARSFGIDNARAKSTLGLIAVLLVVAATAAFATRFDALPAVLGGVALALSAAAALRWPSVLLYIYVASIHLNFAGPPGPLGTVPRVVGIVFVVGYLVPRLRVLRLDAVPVVLWGLLVWFLASSLWAIEPDVAISSWLSLAQLAAVTVLIASIVAAEPKEVGRVMWVYSASAAISAAVGVVNYLQNPAIFLTRATGFEAQDPALFSSALIPAVLYLTYRITSADTKLLVRVLSAAGALSCVAAVALSGTRSAWLALAAAALVWVVLRPSRRLALGFVTVAVAILALALVVPGASDFLLDRTGSAAETGGAGRTDIWSVAYTLFTSSPVAGVGFANFPVAFTQQAIDVSPVSVLAAEDAVVGQGAHNLILASLVETGLIGTTLVVVTMLTILRETGRAGSGTVVQVTLVALLVQSLLLDILLQKQLWLMVAFGLGLAAARRDDVRDRLAQAATPAAVRPAPSGDRRLRGSRSPS